MLEQAKATVTSVQVGAIAPLGAERVPSGFVKTPVTGRTAIGPLGLDGDAQADLSVHGGPDKAVYGYAAEHYAGWTAAFPEHAPIWSPGGLGENLTIAGLDEETVHLGDVYQVGDAVLQVTQPRQPCFKFALRFGDKRLPKAMMKNGWSGWYFRVVREGAVGAGDAVTLLERPNPTWPVGRLNRLILARNATTDELFELAALNGLAEHWRQTAREAAGDQPEF